MNTEFFTTSLIEHCIVSLDTSNPVTRDDARWLRGAISNVMQRQEFHNHVGKKFSYEEPLIRYESSSGRLNIIGINNGALLLKELPRFQSMRLGNKVVKVHRQTSTSSRLDVGVTDRCQPYRFESECLLLNQQNHDRWQRITQPERTELIRRILIGNILSFAKGIGMSVAQRLEVECELVPIGFRVLKPGVRLLGFGGTFTVNFKLPPMWGLGKSTSRGFGTVQSLEVAI